MLRLRERPSQAAGRRRPCSESGLSAQCRLPPAACPSLAREVLAQGVQNWKGGVRYCLDQILLLLEKMYNLGGRTSSNPILIPAVTAPSEEDSFTLPLAIRLEKAAMNTGIEVSLLLATVPFLALWQPQVTSIIPEAIPMLRELFWTCTLESLNVSALTM